MKNAKKTSAKLRLRDRLRNVCSRFFSPAPQVNAHSSDVLYIDKQGNPVRHERRWTTMIRY